MKHLVFRYSYIGFLSAILLAMYEPYVEPILQSMGWLPTWLATIGFVDIIGRIPTGFGQWYADWNERQMRIMLDQIDAYPPWMQRQIRAYYGMP